MRSRDLDIGIVCSIDYILGVATLGSYRLMEVRRKRKKRHEPAIIIIIRIDIVESYLEFIRIPCMYVCVTGGP